MVAVKVRHPGVADTILRDFDTMLALARWVQLLLTVSAVSVESGYGRVVTMLALARWAFGEHNC